MIDQPGFDYAPRRFAWIGERLPDTALSFEFFPPKTPAGAARLEQTLERLDCWAPAYGSVTCGAGGNPAEGTADWVDRLRAAGWQAAAHLTCASTPKADVARIASDYWQAGVRHIVALRGDRPKAGTPAAVTGRDHHRYAADLVGALTAIAAFDISVAAYPEAHPEATSAAADLDNLRRKVDAGARRVITQYCFDTEQILRFRDRVRDRGIDVPLAVGILPIHNFAQTKRFSDACGASVPSWLAGVFAGLDDDPELQALVGASVAAEQARRLVVEGIDHLHFYTMNRAELTAATCRLAGLGPTLARAA